LANGAFQKEDIPVRKVFSKPDTQFAQKVINSGSGDQSAGAHINLTLPSGTIRSYSLVNPSYEENKYQIAVKLEEAGRGGSKEMHSTISEGDIIEISHPKNNFVLYENGASTDRN